MLIFTLMASPQGYSFSILTLKSNIIDAPLNCLHSHSTTKKQLIRAIFSFAADRLFEPSTDHELEINVLIGNRNVPLVEFLNESPLCFYTEDLSLLRGFDLHKHLQTDAHPFPGPNRNCPLGTSRVDVRLEFGLPHDERQSIHDFMESHLAATRANVVYYDHGSGEVADFVSFTEHDGNISVGFFIVSARAAGGHGNRVTDLYEVCSQALKSVVFADPARLIQQLQGRFDRGAGAARFVKGDLTFCVTSCNHIGVLNSSSKWSVVQPGIGRGRISPEMSNLLSATNDHLVRGGFSSLRIMGS